MAQVFFGIQRPETDQDTTKNELVITRTFNAPRTLVWKAWTEPELVMRWWRPRVFTAPVILSGLQGS